MATQTVTEAYLMGIRDERQILKAEIAAGETDLLGFSRSMLASVEATRKQGFGGEMAEYMKGSRDFWRNQVKINLARVS